MTKTWRWLAVLALSVAWGASVVAPTRGEEKLNVPPEEIGRAHV